MTSYTSSTLHSEQSVSSDRLQQPIAFPGKNHGSEPQQPQAGGDPEPDAQNEVLEEQVNPAPEVWPVLVDKITVVCYVADASGNAVNAAAVLANYVNVISQDIDVAEGIVIEEHGTAEITHPNNWATSKIWATKNRLMITTNPTKWLQGDAAFCAMDPHDVIRKTVAEHLDLLSTPGLAIRPSHLSLIHITAMLDAGCPRIARRLLEALKSAARKGRAEACIYPNSIYFGITSSRKSLKVYLDKNKQAYGLRKHEYMGRMLRAEAVLRDLGRQFGQGERSWFEEFYAINLSTLLWDEVTAIRCYTSHVALAHIPELKTNAELGIFTKWKHHSLPENRRLYRRARNSILRQIGIDIYARYDEATGELMQDELSYNALLERNVTALDHRREMASGVIGDRRLAEETRSTLATEASLTT